MEQSTQPRFIRESFEAYQSKRAEYMTSHQLADVAHCPLIYKQKQAGILPEVVGDYYRIGAAAHSLICEGRKEFEQAYVIDDGPINEKTGNPYGSDTKKHLEWLASQVKPVLSTSEASLVYRLEDSVKTHPEAAKLFRNGTPEAVLRETMLGVPCQIRIDYYTAEHGIADLKTCADLDNFEANIAQFGYVKQMAFYRSVLIQHCWRVAPVYLVAVEKKAPHRCGVWLIDDSELTAAAGKNTDALESYKRHKSANHWPTGYEQARRYKAA